MRARVALLLCCFQLLAVAPILAQEQIGPAVADQAEVEFRLGNKAYVARDYERALSYYFASYRLVPNRNVLFNVAKCFENNGQPVEAHRYYTLYMAGLPDAEATQVRAALDRIGRKVGTLKITSEPPGAAVYLDRRDLGSYGVTPAEIVVKPGTYTVILERDGWTPQSLDSIVVPAGGESAREAKLARSAGNVRFSGKPARATLQVLPNGAPQPIDGEFVAVPPGAQRVQISAADYAPQVLDVVVPADRRLTVDYALETLRGTLVVRATEDSASIYVDDVLVGFAPAVIPIPVGTHQVSVRADGFETYRTQVDVDADQRVELEARLLGASEVAAASRVSETVRDAPASVSLIGAREIQAFGYLGTEDALSGTRGIQFSNDLTYSSVGLRGYGPFGQFGNRALVLIDGHTMNDSWVDAAFQGFELVSDLYAFERIEVVRGPTSVLYGSGAFQGVIQLVSPDLSDEFQPSRVGIGASGDRVARGYAHVQETFEGGGVQASIASAQGQPGQFYSPAREATGDPSTAEGVGGLQAYSARLNAKWKDLTVRSFFHTRDKQSPAGAYETLFGDSRAREADSRAFVDARYRHPFSSSAALQLRAYGDYYGYRGQFPYAATDGGLLVEKFRGVWAGLEAGLELRPFEGARWATNLEGVRHLLHRAKSEDEVDRSVAVDTPFWKTSLSSTFRYDFSKRVSVSTGARFDLWSYDALPAAEGEGEVSKMLQNVNPRLVLLLRPYESATLKLIGSRGFRSPSVYELTYNDGGLTQIASPGLTPETIWSSELEYTQVLIEEFEAVVAVYTQQIRDRIEIVGEGVSEDPLQYANQASNLWGSGMDLELRRPFFRGWMASATYSYQRTREGSFGVLLESGNNVRNSPRHMASAKLVSPILAQSLQLANRLVYQAARIDREDGRTPEVLKWDLMLSGKLQSIPLRWAVGVRNLLDWDVRHPVGDEVLDVTLAQPGRSFVADLAMTF